MGFPCLASNKQPVEVGPGIFINRVYSKDSQSCAGNCAMTCLMVWHPAHFHFSPIQAGMGYSVSILPVTTGQLR
ncbi:hypothetical protein ACLB1Q_33685 [Escherichia coli]